MKWIYKTDVGTFWIQPNTNGRFTLGVDNDALGSFATPDGAADDVYMCATGHWPWDKKLIVDEPTGLSMWSKLP